MNHRTQFADPLDTDRVEDAPGTPRVTIGLPVYNGENYLALAIESLLGQSYQDFELVISDNCSTDRTAEICRDYASGDRRIRYLRQSYNIGGIRNFNFAVSQARGRYFKWASHDDICAPNFVARCVEALDADSGLAWCHARSVPIDPYGQPLPDEGPTASWATEPELLATESSPRTARGRLSHSAAARFHGVLLGRSQCLDVYGLIRTKLLRQTRLLLPYWGLEKVLIAELSLLGRYHEVPEPLFYFRIHPAASSALTSVADQDQWCNPDKTAQRAFPRLRLLYGYMGVVQRSQLSPGEKVCCYLSIARYLLQTRKWAWILQSSLRGVSFGGSSHRALHRVERQQQHA